MTEPLETEELFDPALTYPDPDAAARLAGLVGLDDQKERLREDVGSARGPGCVAGLGAAVPRRRTERGRHRASETAAGGSGRGRGMREDRTGGIDRGCRRA